MALAGAVKLTSSSSAALAFSQDAAKAEPCQKVQALNLRVKCAIANTKGLSIQSNTPRVRSGFLAPGLSRPQRSICQAVAAQDVKASEGEAKTGDKVKYSFVVANAKFMLWDEEHFVELMKERLRFYEEQKRELDFWLVYEPEFLNDFPDLTKRLGRPAVALVSTDATWITFMKLRLDRVLKGEFEGSSNSSEALKGQDVKADFKRPEPWTAPYKKYEDKWWEPFLPK